MIQEIIMKFIKKYYSLQQRAYKVGQDGNLLACTNMVSLVSWVVVCLVDKQWNRQQRVHFTRIICAPVLRAYHFSFFHLKWFVIWYVIFSMVSGVAFCLWFLILFAGLVCCYVNFKVICDIVYILFTECSLVLQHAYIQAICMLVW